MENNLLHDEIYEISVGTGNNPMRWSVGSTVNIPIVGRCRVYKILIDTSSFVLNGEAFVSVMVESENDSNFRTCFRSYPLGVCNITNDVAEAYERYCDK